MHPIAYAVSKHAVMWPGRHAAATQRIPPMLVVWSRRLSRSSVASSRQTTSRLSSASKKIPTKQSLKQPLHSSAKTQQSTPTPLMEQQGIAAAAEATTAKQSTTTKIAAPTLEQLKVLFTASAVPMIGFGFMDNIVRWHSKKCCGLSC